MSKDNNSIIVLSGPSGAGKDTVMREVMKLAPDITLSVSATSRPPRGDEQEGVDYYFIDKDEFVKKIENDEFVEYVEYNGKYYGTLKTEVERLCAEGKKVAFVIEVNGAMNIMSKYPDCVSIFLLPPSFEILENRLRKRCTDSEEAIAGRLNIARREIGMRDKYKYNVVNDDLDETVKTVYNIIFNEQ